MEKVEVKFTPICTSEGHFSNPQTQLLAEWCRILGYYGFAPPNIDVSGKVNGSFGNASIRMAPQRKEFIITPSGNDLREEDPVFLLVNRVDNSQQIVYYSGPKLLRPSSETRVHDLIYRLRPKANAILHGHCKLITEYSSELGLRETSRSEDYGTQELVDSVEEMLRAYPKENLYQMKGHGFLALGKNLDEAGGFLIRAYERFKRQLGK